MERGDGKAVVSFRLRTDLHPWYRDDEQCTSLVSSQTNRTRSLYCTGSQLHGAQRTDAFGQNGDLIITDA